MSSNTLGKYQIVREIARSNDIIYEAIDPTLNRRVALKELSIAPNLSPNEREDRRNRFRREAEAAGRLTHPNIISIFDYGTDRDRCYIAMEFLEGQTLRDVIKLRGALGIEESVKITLELLDALAYAHGRSVVHRDIKPDNMQILPGGHMKLTDFGIARLMDEPTITADGQVFGTPSYMSPEQVAGKPIDKRSDLFSVGVVLYEMLTGRKPFSGDSVVSITYNILNREPAPPPGVPPYLAAIVRKAMTKDIDSRYQSAEEMVEDLRNQKAPGTFADPFGAQAQPQPLGGYQPDPFGADPFGSDPFGSPPIANQGSVYTPAPPPPPVGGYRGSSASSSAPMPTSAPDPFLRAPVPSAPPVPSDPALSPEARNFLGIFSVVILLTGLLLLAIWSVDKAYESYANRVSEDRAIGYYNQGIKLQKEGKFKDAMDQFGNAIRVSPKSKTGGLAKDQLVQSFYDLGESSLTKNDTETALWCAKEALKANSKSAAAHLLAGDAYAQKGLVDDAIKEWKAASDVEPASKEANSARDKMGNYMLWQAEQMISRGQSQDAVALYGKIIQDLPGTNAAVTAQQRLDQLNGVTTQH